MSVVWLDTFKNFVANLGTDRDKASFGVYDGLIIGEAQLLNSYRSAWLPRKIVDIPAADATRQWRSWQADAAQINAIEAEESRLGLKEKVKQAVTQARLFGGAGIYIGIQNDDPTLPLRSESAKRIDFLTVMTKRVLTAGEIENDPFEPGYGKPKYYMANGRRVHPSRIAVFIGDPYPDEQDSTDGWGDSVLNGTFQAIKNSDSTMANIASLIYEAKVDVLGIPNLSEWMSTEENRSKLADRTRLAALLKGNNGMLIRDTEETYDSKSFAFANLDNIGNLFLQVVSGAADIPATRLIGRTPGGLNATGEADTRNYYDKIKGIQEDIGTSISILDECLIRSALNGQRPPEIYYGWNALWQASEKERADNGKMVADTIKVISDTGLIPEDELSEAAINMLTEWNIMPGLEQMTDASSTD